MNMTNCLSYLLLERKNPKICAVAILMLEIYKVYTSQAIYNSYFFIENYSFIIFKVKDIFNIFIENEGNRNSVICDFFYVVCVFCFVLTFQKSEELV